MIAGQLNKDHPGLLFIDAHIQGVILTLDGFQSDWMTVHIPIQSGFVQRLVLYKTIENSNIKINRKILLSNGKILIFLRTRYRKVKSENKNVFHSQFTA